MSSKFWRWVLGLSYILAVAAIWIAASFVVQSVVDAGVSPFLVTYICNSLFMVYIPIAEIGRYLVDTYGSVLFWRGKSSSPLQQLQDSEQAIPLRENDVNVKVDGSYSSVIVEGGECSQHGRVSDPGLEFVSDNRLVEMNEKADEELDSKGRWTRTRVAKASLLICPFWFLAQLTFNLSLKYTTVTVSMF